ncbi:MAG: acyl-protein synthetase [Bacillota bacterium]|nr:acyl-protein synthetase [Bacillota bacterium]
MPDARSRLFACKNIYDLSGTEALFVEAVKDSVLHHSRNCGFYAGLLKQRNFNIDLIRRAEDCAKIPAIPASFFKYHEVLSVSEDDIDVHATSSGTQGQKSQMFYDKNSISAGIHMVTNVMRYFGFISFWPTNYIMLGYEPSDENEMGSVKTAVGMTRFAPAIKKVFVLRHTASGYEINRFGILEALQRFGKEGWPLRLIGFPFYLYYMLKLMKDEGIEPLKLNKRSLVLLGGGWKQFDELTIEKGTLYEMTEEMLGIPMKNCRDFYSAVEHSVAYAECENHHMHAPIWSRVFIRDVRTLEPLGYGQPGFLSFVTPLVTSAPLTSVIMGDLAVMHEGKTCGCGIETPYFKVIGRAGTSRMRSCAIAASEFAGEVL